MEKTMQKACRMGKRAKFWKRIHNIANKILNYSKKKSVDYRNKQTELLKSIGITIPCKTEK